MDFQLSPRQSKRFQEGGDGDNLSPTFGRANAISGASFCSNEASALLLPETVSECLCPAGHPMSAKSLKFYEGLVNARKCSTCRGKIQRQQLRHCCGHCDFQICLTCFEMMHLRRHQATLSFGDEHCRRSDQMSCRLRWSKSIDKDGCRLERGDEEIDACSFSSHSISITDESDEEFVVQSAGEAIVRVESEAMKVSEKAGDESHKSRQEPILEEKRIAEDLVAYTYDEFISYFGEVDGKAAWEAATAAVEEISRIVDDTPLAKFLGEDDGVDEGGYWEGEGIAVDEITSVVQETPLAKFLGDDEQCTEENSLDMALDEDEDEEDYLMAFRHAKPCWEGEAIAVDGITSVIQETPLATVSGDDEQCTEENSLDMALDEDEEEHLTAFRHALGTKAKSAQDHLQLPDKVFGRHVDDVDDAEFPEFFRQLGTGRDSPTLSRSGNSPGGKGILRIPEAIGDYGEDLLDRMEQFPAATPSFSLDLRRFVRVGDILNYHGGDLWGHTVLCLTIPRAHEVPLLYASDDSSQVIDSKVSVYILKVLESASNTFGVDMCTISLVVHPRTKQICAAREVPGGMCLITGHGGKPMHVEVLLSPLNNLTMDFEMLQLVVEEIQRVPQDQSWSLRTAVRAYLVKSFLHPDKYATPNRKRQLAWKIGEKWRDRPICSSVPVRVWQKYLLKRSQKPRAELPKLNGDGIPMVRGHGASSHLLYCGLPNVRDSDVSLKRRANTSETSNSSVHLCGPFEGPQCTSCLACQWAQPADSLDAEIAWVEDVLRLMPIKDDRVLPKELFKLLVTTRLWQPLDFRCGPPDHRRGDNAPFSAEFYYHPKPLTRAAILSDLRNAEGAPVQLGSNRFNVYCGRQLGKPQKMLKRAGGTVAKGAESDFFQWNGKCGPEDGPQCQACRRLEDRLAF